MARGGSVGELIGREPELALMVDAIDGVAGGPRAVVIEGEAGIGKTALWRRALDIAGENGRRVLACAPAGSEVRLSFSALGDLLDPVIDESLPELPGPQRRALEIALLRRVGNRAAGETDRRAIGVGTLAALRALAKTAPLVVSIDDVHGSMRRRPPRSSSPCGGCETSPSLSWRRAASNRKAAISSSSSSSSSGPCMTIG